MLPFALFSDIPNLLVSAFAIRHCVPIYYGIERIKTRAETTEPRQLEEDYTVFTFITILFFHVTKCLGNGLPFPKYREFCSPAQVSN
jgi:hypothetical protein